MGSRLCGHLEVAHPILERKTNEKTLRLDMVGIQFKKASESRMGGERGRTCGKGAMGSPIMSVL